MALAPGCRTAAKRTQKVLLPTEYVVEAPPLPPEEPLAAVRFSTGWSDDPIRFYHPMKLSVDGDLYSRTPAITRQGWIEVNPLAEGVTMTLWVRNGRPRKRDFYPVKSFTGEIPGALANEIRFLDDPAPLKGPVRLPISNFRKVYNAYDLSDGDLLMVELHQPSTGRVERAVFQYRAFGLRTKVGYGVLFRVPVPVLQPADTIDVGSLYVTLSLSLGYSYRTSQTWGKWLSDRVAGVVLVGVGSTYEVSTGLGLNEQVRGAFNSALVGTGVEFFDFLSVNALFNPGALTGDQAESTWAVAVGFDASRFATFTEDIVSRLIGRNQLDDSTPRWPTSGGRSGEPVAATPTPEEPTPSPEAPTPTPATPASRQTPSGGEAPRATAAPEREGSLSAPTPAPAGPAPTAPTPTPAP